MSHERSDTITALITGGSGGIGLSLARKFVVDGHSVILVARSEEKLSAARKELKKLAPSASVSIQLMAADLTLPADLDRVMNLLHTTKINVLVNNAGFGWLGNFGQAEWKTYESMISLNIEVLTKLTHVAMSALKKRRSGHIVLLGSVAGFLPGPLMAVYHATKAYVVSLGVALSTELRGSGVYVTTVCPGPTSTDFAAAAKASTSPLFQGKQVMSVEEVATQAYRAIQDKKVLVVTGQSNRLLALLGRLLPMEWVAQVSLKVQKASELVRS